MLEMNTFIKHFIADIVCSQKDFKLHIKFVFVFKIERKSTSLAIINIDR